MAAGARRVKLRPWWMMAGGAFSSDDCARLIDLAWQLGWRAGGHTDGTERPGVSVCHIPETQGPVAAGWIAAFRRMAPVCAAGFGVDIQPELLRRIQVSRWQPGDGYGMHPDQDWRRILPVDRKLSLYVALTDGGGLALRAHGMIHCQTGDMLAFGGTVPHAVPTQKEGERYSVVAWITGPDWR